MKKLSIIIPMFNVAQYLEKCIGSVYTQEINEEEFEIIVVDDESPDNSLAVAKTLTKDKKNVTIISQKNKGLGGARNTGIQHATGTYLLFLDSDDWYLPDTVQKLLQKAMQLDLEILEFGAQGIDIDGKIEYTVSISSSQIFNGVDYYNSVRYSNSACNKLYKRDFLKKNNLFFLERIFIEDFEFNTRVFAKAERVYATDYLVAQFLQSPNSITRNTNVSQKEKIINDMVTVLEQIKGAYQEYESSTDRRLHSYFKERIGFIVATLFYQLLKNKATYREIKNIRQELIEKKLFYIDHVIFQNNKDWFRKVMLKNMWTFQISQRILKFL